MLENEYEVEDDRYNAQSKFSDVQSIFENIDFSIVDTKFELDKWNVYLPVYENL